MTNRTQTISGARLTVVQPVEDMRALLAALGVVRNHPQAQLKGVGAKQGQNFWNAFTPEVIAALAALTLVVPMGPVVLLIPAMVEAALGDKNALHKPFNARGGATGQKIAESAAAQEICDALEAALKAGGKFVLMIALPNRRAAQDLETQMQVAAGYRLPGARFIAQREGLAAEAAANPAIVPPTAVRPAQAFPAAANEPVYVQAGAEPEAQEGGAAPVALAPTVLGKPRATFEIAAAEPAVAPAVGVITDSGPGAANDEVYTLAA
jgi:hypothetical protein